MLLLQSHTKIVIMQSWKLVALSMEPIPFLLAMKKASFSFICSLVIISPVITFATRFLVLDSYLSQLSTQYFFPFQQLKPYQTRSVMAFLITVQGHLHTNRDCDNVWTFILTDATFKSAEI